MENKPYRGGRPRLSEEESSCLIVKFRISPAEHKILVERKSTTNLPNLSSYLRYISLDKPLPMKTLMESYQNDALSMLVEMRADMLRMGVNINQATKRINSTTDYRDLQREVNNMQEQMNLLEGRMEQLMGIMQPPHLEIRTYGSPD